MSEANDWNTKVIAEFRANAGKVTNFEAMPLLLLHHKGAKSGKAYTNPLAYLDDGGRYVIFASKGGAPTNPDWYHNVVANPDVQIELPGQAPVAAKASVAEGAEHDRLYDAQVAKVPQFGGYRDGTTRVIPVVVIEKV